MLAVTSAIRNVFSHWIALGVIYGLCGILLIMGMLFALTGFEHMLAARIGEPNASFIVAGSLLLVGAIAILAARTQSRSIASSLKRISRRANMAMPDRTAIQERASETLKAPSVQIAAILGGALVFAATKLLEAMRSVEPKYEILPPLRPHRPYTDDSSTVDAAAALVSALNRDARSVSQRTADAANEVAPHISQFATSAAKWLTNAAIAESKAIRDSEFLQRIWPRRSFTNRASHQLLNVVPSTREGLLLAGAAALIVYFLQKGRR